jgi:TolB protein
MRSDGSDLVHVPEDANEDDYYASPSWSPDGKRIVFFSDEGTGSNLHVMDANGSNDHPITESGALLGVWSPHSDWIAAFSWEPASGPDEIESRLYLMRPDGSERKKLAGDLSEPYFAWSPVP